MAVYKVDLSGADPCTLTVPPGPYAKISVQSTEDKDIFKLELTKVELKNTIRANTALNLLVDQADPCTGFAAANFTKVIVSREDKVLKPGEVKLELS